MAPPIPQLTWRALTTMINEMKDPARFLASLLFGRHETLPTEVVDYFILNGARVTAPMVKGGSEAQLVDGHTSSIVSLRGPHMRLKQAFTPSELLSGRLPNTTTQVTAPTIREAVEAHIARDMKRMREAVENTIEVMVSQAIQGAISYARVDGEVFQITYPKPAGNTVALAIKWDDVDPALPTPELDFLAVKTAMSDSGLYPTHCILGAAAAAAFISLMRRMNQPSWVPIISGGVDMTTKYTASGAIPLGTFCGIQVWSYPRTVSVEGVVTPLIRSKYAEFVCATPEAENVMYYCAIPENVGEGDMLFQGEMFSKSWMTEDPPQRLALLHTRPFPAPRRPQSFYSAQVVT